LEHLHQDLSQRVIAFDQKSFEENMSHYLGEVSDEQTPTRPVTKVHVDLLQSIRNCVDIPASKRPISHWITSIKFHLQEASTSTSSLAGTVPKENIKKKYRYIRIVIICTQDHSQVVRAESISQVSRTISLGANSRISPLSYSSKDENNLSGNFKLIIRTIF
jgi:hypothetical protein